MKVLNSLKDRNKSNVDDMGVVVGVMIALIGILWTIS